MTEEQLYFLILAFLAFTGIYVIPVSWNVMRAGDIRKVTIKVIRITYYTRLGERYTDLWVQHLGEHPPVYEDLRLIGRIHFGLQETYILTLVSKVAFYGYEVWYDVTEYLHLEN